MDRKFILFSLGYALVGLLLGMVMAGTHNHGQLVTHAHLMLAGFVVSFLYGLCHKLWLNNASGRLAQLQYYIHHVGVIVLIIGLFLYYGSYVAQDVMDPILGLSSFLVFIGMLLMTVLFVKARPQV